MTNPAALVDLVHDFPFDPTYGYTICGLREVGPPDDEPGDFDSFWLEHYQRAIARPPRFELTEVAPHAPGRRTFTIRFGTTDQLELSGWVDIPAHGKVEAGLVMLHGYGGRPEGPKTEVYIENCVVISPGLRGLAPSLFKEIPPDAYRHVLHGIETRDRYILGGCVEDVWCAANTLCDAFPECQSALHLIGSSFGGGIGLIALAFDPRFRMAHVSVPTFGNHPLRLTMPCNGSGEAVRQHYQTRPEILKVLRYFDSATAAKRIRIPVAASPALFDPSVPPPGQFAACNALRGPKALFIHKTGHFDQPETVRDNRAEFEILCDWFAAGPEKAIQGEILAPSLRTDS